MDTVIELSGVVAVLGQFPALAGVDLTVQRGEIVLLQGPNGAGKTSLLRVCAGLLPIERGSGHVLGIDLATNREAIRSRVGLLGHANGLYLDLTVMQNMKFWASTVGATALEVSTAMETMRIDGRLASVKASQLSAGQRRRCALASLIVRRAEIWLLDEPHAGLDAAGRRDGYCRGGPGANAGPDPRPHGPWRASHLPGDRPDRHHDRWCWCRRGRGDR